VPPAVRKATVLVVEDDSALRALFRTQLTVAGYAVVDVEDGLDALRHIETAGAPNAVVLDLDLPRLSGRDVKRELAAHSYTAKIPVVVVTGGETRDLNVKDFACVLRKPVHVDALIFAIENCLKRRDPTRLL
jgi:two-component system phosphate regulon response regulator PhoB